jgi:hypothetical protein
VIQTVNLRVLPHQRWTLKQAHSTATNNEQVLLANVEDQLNVFSDNGQEIISRFKRLEQMWTCPGFVPVI